MPPILRLTEEQYNDIASLLALPVTKLEAAVNELELIDADALALRQIHAALRRSLDRENADALGRLLVTVATFRRHQDITSGAAVKSLTRGVERFSDWEEPAISQWNNFIVPVLKSCLNVEAVHVIAKTADMAFDYDNLLNRISILTDLRPVFDVNKAIVVGGIVSSLLRVEYRNSIHQQSMTIALDRSDIEKLAKECDDALRKISALERTLGEGRKIATIENGEEIYDLT